MSSDKDKIEKLANDFLNRWRNEIFPRMGAVDFLDLMDYFSRKNMDFEAELCRYIAEEREPENPEVLLTKAHFCADEGDWFSATTYIRKGGFTGYDFALFTIEQFTRAGKINQAVSKAISSTPRHLEVPDFDFLFDCASLFRDFGYAEQAIVLIEKITPEYIDYYQAQELRFHCCALTGQYEKAKHIINSLIDRNSFNHIYWSQLAICCYRNKEYEEAFEACENALAITSSPEMVRLRILLTVRKASDQDCKNLVDEQMYAQDHLMHLEFGDILMQRGFYYEASESYRKAAVTCPRSTSDRLQIVIKLIHSLIHENHLLEVMDHLKSIVVYCGDAWSAGFEAAQIAFERGFKYEAVEVLQFTALHSMLTSSRCGELALLLAHYRCGEEAKEIWQILKDNAQLMPKSYLHYLPD